MFKINLKPVVKDRDFEVKIVQAGRKQYNCCVCSKIIDEGKPSITFTKRVSVGTKTTFETHRTCYVKDGVLSECTVKKAKQLNVNLENLW